MNIEAPCSKYKKTNFKIGIVLLLVLAVWCAYDGYGNKDWIEEHTTPEGNPKPYLIFNQQAPYYLIGAAVLLGIYMTFAVKRHVVADDRGIVINDKNHIPYSSVEKIDKTYFDKKGYFIITYSDRDGRERRKKLSDRNYDNLQEILDRLVAEIS